MCSHSRKHTRARSQTNSERDSLSSALTAPSGSVPETSSVGGGRGEAECVGGWWRDSKKNTDKQAG